MKRLVVVMVLVARTLTAQAGGRERTTALALSGIGTGVSSALIVSSVLFQTDTHEVNSPLLYSGLATSVFTPSLGEWYAGEWLTVGMGVRTAAALLAAYGIQQTDEVRCLSPGVQTCKEINGTGVAVLGLAAIAFVGGAAYDVLDADDAVDRYNSTHTMILAPTLLPSGGGVELVGTF